MAAEEKVLRKICGPKTEQVTGLWRSYFLNFYVEEEYKSTSAQQSIHYYHTGVKVDNMFRLSGSHHQVQYKDT